MKRSLLLLAVTVCGCAFKFIPIYGPIYDMMCL